MVAGLSNVLEHYRILQFPIFLGPLKNSLQKLIAKNRKRPANFGDLTIASGLGFSPGGANELTTPKYCILRRRDGGAASALPSCVPPHTELPKSDKFLEATNSNGSLSFHFVTFVVPMLLTYLFTGLQPPNHERHERSTGLTSGTGS